MSEDIREKVKKKVLGSVTILIGLGISAVIAYNCFFKVPVGQAALLYNLDGGIEDRTYGQGLHFCLPWKTPIIYPVSTEVVNLSKPHGEGERDNSVNVSTSDGKTVTASVMYSFRMDPDMLPVTYTKFRGQSIGEIESGYLKSELLRCINEVTSQYNLMQLIGDKRQEINEKVLAQFKESLAGFGIIIESISISEIQPDESTATAIAKVVEAQNRLEQARVEKETAEVEAQKRVIEAQSKADANRLLQESLTDNIIKEHAIQKWNGSIPNVMGSGEFLFNIPIGGK